MSLRIYQSDSKEIFKQLKDSWKLSVKPANKTWALLTVTDGAGQAACRVRALRRWWECKASKSPGGNVQLRVPVNRKWKNSELSPCSASVSGFPAAFSFALKYPKIRKLRPPCLARLPIPPLQPLWFSQDLEVPNDRPIFRRKFTESLGK